MSPAPVPVPALPNPGRQARLLLLLGLVACLALSACGKTAIPFSPEASQGSGRGVQAVHTARSVIGTPYVYGGESPSTGFDCSGLAYWVYGVSGATLPRSSRDQITAGSPVDLRAILPGDLVFFDVDGSYHVGIYAGQGAFIHSPKSGGYVREEEMYKDFWMRRFLAARRVL